MRRSSRASRPAPGRLLPPKAVQQQRQKAYRATQSLRIVQTPPRNAKKSPTPKRAQRRNTQAQSRRFPAARTRKHTQVVVGNGMVGQRLVELCADKLEERGASDQVDIVSFSRSGSRPIIASAPSWFETRDADDLIRSAPTGRAAGRVVRERGAAELQGPVATCDGLRCGQKDGGLRRRAGLLRQVRPRDDLPPCRPSRARTCRASVCGVDDLEALVAYQKAHGACAARNFFFASTARGSARRRRRGLGASTPRRRGAAAPWTDQNTKKRGRQVRGRHRRRPPRPRGGQGLATWAPRPTFESRRSSCAARSTRAGTAPRGHGRGLGWRCTATRARRLRATLKVGLESPFETEGGTIDVGIVVVSAGIRPRDEVAETPSSATNGAASLFRHFTNLDKDVTRSASRVTGGMIYGGRAGLRHGRGRGGPPRGRFVG